jgi:hypothetical protein
MENALAATAVANQIGVDLKIAADAWQHTKVFIVATRC